MKQMVLACAITLLVACQEQQVISPPPISTADSNHEYSLGADDPGYIAENPRYADLIGLPGPAISLQALDGTVINLADVYGTQPVYLKLWASFCIPCRVQMPGFERIYQSMGEQMLVVAVNAGVGDDLDKVSDFVLDEDMNMPVAIDDGSLGAWLEMQETPLSLIIGLDGRIAFAGHQDGPALHAAIEHVLSTPAGELADAIETVTVPRLPSLSSGDEVPRMVLHNSEGADVGLGGQGAGRPQAILFTAIWCEDYLLQTEPETAQRCQRVREQISQLAMSDTVEWSGIVSHLWTTPEALKAFEEQAQPPVPLVVDTAGTAFRVFGIRRFPAVALIDAEGKLMRVIGPDEEDLAGAVENLANASSL